MIIYPKYFFPGTAPNADSSSSPPHSSLAISNKKHFIIRPRRTSIIVQEVKDLEDRFYAITKDFRNQLDRKTKDVTDVFDTLLSLPPRLHLIYSPFLEKNFHCLDKSDSHKELFFKMNSCWNFLDCELFLHVVRKHGDVELNRLINIYRDDIQKFRQCTSVYQLVQGWEESPYRPYDEDKYRKSIVKLDRDSKTCSLEELECFRKVIIYDQPLSIAAFIFHELKIHCVTMVWLVAKEEVSILYDSLTIKSNDSDFITRHAIHFWSLDDHIFYPMNDLCIQYWNACRNGYLERVEKFLESRDVDPNHDCEV